MFQLKPNPPVLDFQARLFTAVTLYAESSGTPSAFVTDEDGAGINQTTINWVEHYVPDQIDTQYIAHLTPGSPPSTTSRRPLRALRGQPYQRGRLPPRQQRDRPHPTPHMDSLTSAARRKRVASGIAVASCVLFADRCSSLFEVTR